VPVIWVFRGAQNQQAAMNGGYAYLTQSRASRRRRKRVLLSSASRIYLLRELIRVEGAVENCYQYEGGSRSSSQGQQDIFSSRKTHFRWRKSMKEPRVRRCVINKMMMKRANYGVSSGFKDLDSIYLRLSETEMIVLRRSSLDGKNLLALNIAEPRRCRNAEPE